MKTYIIENGTIQNTGLVFWYDKKLFTSKKSCLHYIENSFEVNKGFNKVLRDDTFEQNVKYIDYSCLSTDNREMKVLLRITELKPYYN
jgi:hypothetical protein